MDAAGSGADGRERDDPQPDGPARTAPPPADESPGGLRGSVRQWRGTLQQLKDNPVAHYWQLARRRRRRRMSALRRHAPTGLTLLGTFAIFIAALAIPGGGFINRTEDLVASLYGFIVLPTAFVWVCTGLYDGVRDAATLLSHSMRKLAAGQLDELLAVAPLTDRELLAGVMRKLLPPLYRRALVIGLVLWGGLLLVAYLDTGSPERRAQALILGPLTTAAVAAQSALAMTALTLLAVILGNRARHGATAAVTASLVALWPLFWLPVSAAVFGIQQWPELNPARSAIYSLIGAALLLGFGLLGLRAARATRAAPAYSVIGIPAALTIVYLALLAGMSGNDYYFLGSGGEEQFGWLASCLAWAMGSFAPVNFLAVPSPLCWGDAELTAGALNPLNFILLLLLQLLIVLLLADHALLHLRERRSGMN